LNSIPLIIAVDYVRLDPHGVLAVAGWAAGALPVDAIEVSVGATILGEANYGRARPDVHADHPNLVNAAKSGFNLLARLTDDLLEADEAQVTVRLNGGLTRTASTRISRPPTIKQTPATQDGLFFHCDILELLENGAMTLTGWAARRGGLKSIEIYLDGVQVGEARLGFPRPDVAADHPDISLASTSGFEFRQRIQGIEPGEHRVALIFRTSAGQTMVRELTTATQTTSSLEEIKINVDTPAVADGAFVHRVRRMLSIEGWAVARSGIAAIDIFLDDAPIASAIRGIRRLDIATAFPDWLDSALAGFRIQLPRKLFRRESHVLRLQARDRNGGTNELALRVHVDETDLEAEVGALRTRVAQSEIDLKTALIDASTIRPAFTLFLAAGHEEDFALDLEQTLASLREQAFTEFQLVFLTTSPHAVEAAKRVSVQSGVDLRITRCDLDSNAENALVDASKYWSERERKPFFLFLRTGDRLGADALLEFALELATRPEQEFVYADDRRRDPRRGKTAAFFKPEWSPDLLWSTNYIGRTWCAAAALAERVGARPSSWLEAGDFDWLLRFTEISYEIGRTPLVLAELMNDGDESVQEKTALRAAMARGGVSGGLRNGRAPGVYRVRRDLTSNGLVSIVIPTIGSRGRIESCVTSIRKLTHYPNFEIVCVDNTREPNPPWRAWLAKSADRVVECRSPFNWSTLSIAGAEAARGEYLLFLNDDIEVVDPRWLHALMEHAERSEVGVVGPRLVYPDGRVQHGGMYLIDRGARHAFRYAEDDDSGPFGLAAAERNVVAVTGACMLMRRDVFDSVRQSTQDHTVVNNDLDLCLRVWRMGKRVVYTPHTSLIHHENPSRGDFGDSLDEADFDPAWRNTFALGDPFLHPRLSRDENDYAPDLEPTRVVFAGRPLFAHESVRRILVQKLDHVGDFVTGLPAIQRLKQRFPKAEIHVLASSASAPIAQWEPSIDNVIEFNFFHPISQEGRLDVGEFDWLALEAQLKPLRFDIAVDLRKHTETREVLKHSGAKLLAGFDLRGAYPWLDVALEWDGDYPYLPKRTQVADDYVALVDAISLACERERRFLDAPAPTAANEALRATPSLADLRPGFFERPIVCVHPAAGNVLRQWPAEYFAQLIELITEAYDVNIALVGAPHEAAVVEAILDKVGSREKLWSLVGKTKMPELRLLFRQARLFIGNNSGPHHLAAAMGTPTIGIHSGVVSAKEWGPIGPSALALQRDMSCSPCYLDTPAKCSRGLACLRGLRPADVFRACEQMLGASLRFPVN
jgi:ADP-heptose:LPS heptosyltransferase/GT2 family glycosyltransferase